MSFNSYPEQKQLVGGSTETTAAMLAKTAGPKQTLCEVIAADLASQTGRVEEMADLMAHFVGRHLREPVPDKTDSYEGRDRNHIAPNLGDIAEGMTALRDSVSRLQDYVVRLNEFG